MPLQRQKGSSTPKPGAGPRTMFPCPLDVAGAWSIWRALGVNSFEFAGDAVSLLQIKANIQANPSRANTKGSSLASERARLKSLAESLARERDAGPGHDGRCCRSSGLGSSRLGSNSAPCKEELDRWKTSAFVEISDHKSAVARRSSTGSFLGNGWKGGVVVAMESPSSCPLHAMRRLLMQQLQHLRLRAGALPR